jgi:dTMP kinase
MPIKIDFEGTDGAGKTTGLKFFVNLAKEIGLNVVETREVGNPHIPVCMKLREIVLAPENSLSGEAMECIFSAMRIENDAWFRRLQDTANSPDLVVSDRGWLSHLAYTDHNVSPQFTEALYENFVGNITMLPDAIIYFAVSPETALKRRIKRGGDMDVIETKGVEFQDKVRQSFDKYIQRYQDKLPIYIVDANKDLSDVKVQLTSIFIEIYRVDILPSLKTENSYHGDT